MPGSLRWLSDQHGIVHAFEPWRKHWGGDMRWDALCGEPVQPNQLRNKGQTICPVCKLVVATSGEHS